MRDLRNQGAWRRIIQGKSQFLKFYPKTTILLQRTGKRKQKRGRNLTYSEFNSFFSLEFTFIMNINRLNSWCSANSVCTYQFFSS